MAYKKLYNTPKSVPIEVSTSSGMEEKKTQENLDKVFEYTGDSTATYKYGALYLVEEKT